MESVLWFHDFLTEFPCCCTLISFRRLLCRERSSKYLSSLCVSMYMGQCERMIVYFRIHTHMHISFILYTVPLFNCSPVEDPISWLQANKLLHSGMYCIDLFDGATELCSYPTPSYVHNPTPVARWYREREVRYAKTRLSIHAFTTHTCMCVY